MKRNPWKNIIMIEERFAIFANVIQDKVLRNSARVLIMLSLYRDNVKVKGLSKSGRRVEKWIPVKRLERFRVKYLHKDQFGISWGNREEAEEYLEGLNKWLPQDASQTCSTKEP